MLPLDGALVGKGEPGAGGDELLNGVLDRHSLARVLNRAMLGDGLRMPQDLIRRASRPWPIGSTGFCPYVPCPASAVSGGQATRSCGAAASNRSGSPRLSSSRCT